MIDIILSSMHTASIKYLTVLTGVILLALSLSPASAASANLSKSYLSNSVIPDGSLVSLDSARQDYVVAANSTNGSKLLGVSVASQESLLAIDPGSNKVQVAINGSANALVSTVNGDINVGDQVSVSPFNGIGMESMAGSHLIGIAQTSFTDHSSGATTENVTDKSGKTHQIKVGFLKVSIGIGIAGTGAGGTQANFLQRLVKSLTGHTISTLRIVLSMVVSLIALVSLVTLIYASIYGSIIAVGRNPLAKTVILRTLLSVMLMAIITVAIASTSIYYLLR